MRAYDVIHDLVRTLSKTSVATRRTTRVVLQVPGLVIYDLEEITYDPKTNTIFLKAPKSEG